MGALNALEESMHCSISTDVRQLVCITFALAAIFDEVGYLLAFWNEVCLVLFPKRCMQSLGTYCSSRLLQQLLDDLLGLFGGKLQFDDD